MTVRGFLDADVNLRHVASFTAAIDNQLHGERRGVDAFPGDSLVGPARFELATP
jgi:hypothetical protein